MKLLSKTLVLALLLLFPVGILSSVSEKTFSPDQLKSDFNGYRNLIEQLQPGLYHYHSKDKLDAEFDRIASELNKDLTALEFFQKLTRLNKLYANVHTKFTPPKAIWDRIKSEVPIFPLEVYWHQGKLYSLRDLSENQRIDGVAEIISINGDDAVELFLRLRDTLHRDGFNQTYPVRRTYTSFAFVYASQVGMPAEFDIKFKQDGKVNSETFKAISENQKKEIKKKRFPNASISWEQNEEKAFSLDFQKDTAILKLRTFSTPLIKARGQDWKKFLKDAFKKIRRTESSKLIIDLRGNSGGQTAPGFFILRYLAKKPFIPFKSITAKVALVPKGDRFQNQSAVESFDSYKWKLSDGVYKPSVREDFKPIKPFKKRFKGRIYVLVDAFSNSATGTFSGQLKTQTNAVFIGEETGGNPVHVAARQTLRYELPNTKVQTTIPLVLSIKNVNFENKGRGLIPDHEVAPTPVQLIRGDDPVIRKAFGFVGD